MLLRPSHRAYHWQRNSILLSYREPRAAALCSSTLLLTTSVTSGRSGTAVNMSTVHFTFMEPKSRSPGSGTTLYEAWKVQIGKLLSPEDQTRFSVIQSTLQELKPPHSHFDCAVSPANSYGIMDGG